MPRHQLLPLRARETPQSSCPGTKEESTAIFPGREPDSSTRARPVPLSWDAAVHCRRQAVEGHGWFPLLLPEL